MIDDFYKHLFDTHHLVRKDSTDIPEFGKTLSIPDANKKVDEILGVDIYTRLILV